ncbi:MAG: serine protease [Synergistaceae bacterium]|nr:serine protease [Synergistaceae bacterium]
MEDDDDLASGSGFIVGDGYIATNAHVVDGLGKGGAVYVLNERIPARKAEVVNVIHEDKDEAVSGRDFALLRFDPPKGAEFPVLSFNFDVKRMDRVSAWGYPAMATQFDASTQRLQRGDSSRLESPPVIYTEGTVNAIVKDKLGSSILHSASIAGGNSGGPLVNGRGEVIGMNTWGYKEEDEGAFLNGAQLAAEIAFFLADNGVTPRLAPGQQMAARPERSGDWARGGESPEDRRRRFGDLSVVIPRGWSVIDEDEDMFLVGADDGAAAVGIAAGDMEGQSLRQLASALSKELGGTAPERDDDGVYVFSFSDDGTDTLVCIAEDDEKSLYMAVFISGDREHPGVEKLLDSIE